MNTFSPLCPSCSSTDITTFPGVMKYGPWAGCPILQRYCNDCDKTWFMDEPDEDQRTEIGGEGAA